MGKVRRSYVCSSCRRASAQWSGRCAGCGSWGTIEEDLAGGPRAAGVRGRPPVLTLAPEVEEHRISTGFPSVDRVLGGGLVPGSVVLLAGAPGIGKSTLVLQLASRLTAAGHPCLLASGEESRAQVAARAGRLGLDGGSMAYVPGRDLAEVMAATLAERPTVLMVDSMQTLRDPDSDAMPGGVGQVRACADALTSLAKEHGISVLLAGHVTKEGDLAGPRTLEHAVDCVMAFEGDTRTGLRILAGGKNRFGAEGEVAWFEMTSTGLVEADIGSRVGSDDGEPGCAIALAMAGRRGLAVEVQALVVPTQGPPRRQVSGLDGRRFQIVAAVADHVGDLSLGRAELFGAAAGGLRLDDPGADLAVAASLASAVTGIAIPRDTGFVGELSLTGSVRPVAAMEQRLSAGLGAGLRSVVLPRGSVAGPHRGGLHLVGVAHLRDALAWMARSRRGTMAERATGS